MKKEVLNKLEINIENALKVISDLQEKINYLLQEKRELESLQAEKELRISGLQKEIEDLKKNSNQDLLEHYKQNEKELKDRIKNMLVKLENLDL